MTVRIITDSAADLPHDVIAAHDIRVVPMWLTIGGAPVRENEVSVEDVVARFDEGVTTAGPSPGDFVEAFEQLGDGDEALVLTVAEHLSSTFESAFVGTKSLDPAAAQRIRVVSTDSAAGAQGLIVLHAAKVAQAGASLDGVEAAARRVMAQVRLVATLDSLEWLVKGGRVPTIAGWAGGALHVRPVVELRPGGRIVPVRPAFGREASLERVVHHWRRTIVADHDLHVGALHALAESDARHVLDIVRAEVEPATAFVTSFTTIMVAHTGPGLCGLAWWWEPRA
jgi:DegV family protein with EDD domain